MPYKLLLADDSLTIQKVVELVLAPENFEIRACNDGEQALQAMASFVPDIILADIEMPKLNGYQLCEKIKNDMATGHIPVILLAGAFEPFDEEYAKNVYADDFIIKPFESQELISKVKALLASSMPAKDTSNPEVIEMPEAPVEIEEVASASAGEPSWDLDISVAQEEPAPAVATEATSEAPAGFEDELLMALKDEGPEQKEESGEQFTAPLEESLADVLAQPFEENDLKPSDADIQYSQPDALAGSAGKAISDIAPGIIENVTRELVKDLLGSLRGEIEIAIRKIVPEVAEAIIKKEIEKITSELK